MHSDVTKYQPQLEILVAFVEGRLDGPQLNAALATKEMKELLSIFEEARYPAVTNHYRRLHNNQDRTSLAGLVNSEGIIEDFLQKAEITFRSGKRYGSLYSLILSAVPKYLEPPMEFMIEKIVPSDSSLSETQKKALIKERLKENFKYVDKPPNWIQSPDWPIRNGLPLIFVGQLSFDAPELFHDKGAAYVFYNPVNGAFETLAQLY